MRQKKSYINKKSSGFTLIELLIVIAIIGILAVSFVPKLFGALGKSRDTQRITDVTAIKDYLLTQVISGKALPPTTADCVNNADAANPAQEPDAKIGEAINENLAQFSGTFPLDSDKTHINKAGVKSCTGQYAYIKYDKSKAGYSAGVIASVEKTENGNTVCELLRFNVKPVLYKQGEVPLAANQTACYVQLVE